MNTSELQHSTATFERITQIAEDLIGDIEITLTPDTRPSEVDGWDSLATVSIIFAIEDEFQIRLADDALAGFETVGDLAVMVDRSVGLTAKP
jgi:acyl carrier protein